MIEMNCDAFYVKTLFHPFSIFSGEFLVYAEDKSICAYGMASDFSRLLFIKVNNNLVNAKIKDETYAVLDIKTLMKFLNAIKSEKKLKTTITNESIELSADKMRKTIRTVYMEHPKPKKLEYEYDTKLRCKRGMFDCIEFVALSHNDIIFVKDKKRMVVRSFDETSEADISEFISIEEDKKEKFESMYFATFITDISSFVTDDFEMTIGEVQPVVFDFSLKENIARCIYAVAPRVLKE